MKCADPVTGAFFILLRPPPILARFRALGIDFRALSQPFRAWGIDFRALSQPFRALSDDFRALGIDFRALSQLL
ncbi:hypothetical protein ABWW58_10930 [Sporolactobacillus sp. STCC-11]|uniref:hypothetical protein n=1 Tax=Sporolactobacillus caesalpiniae TaxID=3230362 RepID=UPI003397E04C